MSTVVKQRIIAAALHIIGTDGVAAVSNRRIAAQAGVSLGSITYHFATQHDLLHEALLDWVAGENERLTALAVRYRDTDLDIETAAALVDRIAADIAFSTERIAEFELYIQAGRTPALRDAAAACFEAYDALAVTMLTAVGVPNPERTASTVVAVVTGMRLRQLATGAPAPNLAEALLLVAR